MGVAKAVEGEVLHVYGSYEGDESFADVVGVLVGSDDGGEDVAGFLLAVTYEFRCGELPLSVLSQDLDCAFVDVDHSARASEVPEGDPQIRACPVFCVNGSWV